MSRGLSAGVLAALQQDHTLARWCVQISTASPVRYCTGRSSIDISGNTYSPREMKPIAIPIREPGAASGRLVVDNADAALSDLVFSEEQLLGSTIPGISYDVKATRESKRRVIDYARRRPTVFLPAHDPLAPQRLAQGTTIALR